MKKLTYEAGLAELTELIDRIESGQLTLEETLKAYEKGSALAEKLAALLQEGRGRVMQLQPDGTESSFEEDAE